LYSGGVCGSIVFDASLFQVKPPDWFQLQLDLLIDTATRDKEANVRLLIGHYLSHAVNLARIHLKLPRLAFHSELDLTEEIVPNVGLLSGTVDFVCATIQGAGGLGMSFSLVHQLTKGDLMSGPEGGVDFILDTPYLVILEAKKTDTLALHSSKAELLGQVRVLLQKLFTPSHQLLTVSTGRGRTGILTDGFQWKIFHLDTRFRMFSSKLTTDTPEQRLHMLGIDPTVVCLTC
jgi:hypothetical protein